MAMLRRILSYLRSRKSPGGGYADEVLYAGWVNAPRVPGKKDKPA
jgi:hypothetical protein